MMILKVAWRNIWRNKLRSGVVIIAITIGLWAGVFASGFVIGMMEQRMDSVVNMELSHLQVHHPAFRDELLPEYTIENHSDLLNKLQNDDEVNGISQRVISMPMLMSPRYSGAIKVSGIVVEDEKQVTQLYKYIKEGSYLNPDKRNKILISSETAEEYKLEMRSTVVLRVQNIDGDIVDMRYRVGGIYETDNPMYDKMNAFVKKEELQSMLGIGNEIHEIAVMLDKHSSADAMASKYQETFKNSEILSWKDLSPGMRYMIQAMDTYTVVIVGIIMVALLFSIINTMLMAVLERVQEIGMLMAIGMSKWRVFLMIMLETILLSLIGGLVGLLVSWGTISYFGKHGIDLGDAAYGDMGFDNLIYPQLGFDAYIDVTFMVVGMAVIGALYPARKALKLIPVEAIRKI